jgi:hypothetical protein
MNAVVDVGAPVTAATGAFLLAPALDATADVTFSGASVSPAGEWSTQVPYNLAVSGTTVAVDVPPAAAVLIRAR